MGLLITLGSIVIPIGSQQAQANVDETLLDLGDQALTLGDRLPSVITVNGVSLKLLSGSSTEAYADLLDRFYVRCHAWSGIRLPAFESRSNHIGSAHPSEPSPDSSGVIRLDGDRRGVVACLDTNGKVLGPLDLLSRALGFARTGDLGAIGQLRYLIARQAENGKSVYLTAWTEGTASLSGMFPRTGDAPGNDLIGVPRPRSSSRSLAVSEATQRLGLVVYRTSQSCLDAAAEYRADLLNAGWQVTDSGAASTTSISLIVRKGDRMILVTSQSVESASFIALVELASP